MKHYINLKFDIINSNCQLDKDRTVIVVQDHLFCFVKAFVFSIFNFFFVNWLLVNKIFWSTSFQFVLEGIHVYKFVLLLIDSIDHNNYSLYKKFKTHLLISKTFLTKNFITLK
jgi:hypothetical protein